MKVRCKTGKKFGTIIYKEHSSVAQLVERSAVNRMVVGSSPTGRV